MKMLLKQVVLLVVLGTCCIAQTLATYTGVIKDLAQNVVTSGQVTFTLTLPSTATIPGTGTFTPTTISCNINVDGTLSGFVGGVVNGPCMVTMNTALTPAGTAYRICIQPNFNAPGSCFYDYAIAATKDITTVVPTLSTGPLNYSGIPGPPLNFTGVWSATTSYATGVLVSFNNLVYISLVNSNLNNTPSSSPSSWSVVISPASLLALPTGTQHVAQPLGTTMGVNSLNGVLEATEMVGTGNHDIGDKINAAITQRAGTCGTITIAPGNYSFSTQIHKPRCVTIEGNNAVLTWTGTDALTPAIVAGSVVGVDDTTQGGIRHLKLVPNTAGTGSGIYLGNKVGSYNVPSNPNIQELLDTFLDVDVVGFVDNYVKGSNVFQDTWIAGSSQQATHAGWNDVGLFGSENMSFFGWEVLNGQGGMGFFSTDLRGSEYNFYNCSFDYNSGGQFNYVDGIVRISGGHIEEFSEMGPLFTSGSSSSAFTLILSGALSFVVGCDPLQGTCTTLSSLIVVGGTNSNVMIAPGLTLTLPNNMTNLTTHLVQWNALGGSNDLIVGEYTEPLAPNVTTIPTVLAGSNIQYQSTPIYGQFTPTDSFRSSATISFATLGATPSSGFVGAVNSRCASGTTDFPLNGNYLGWNCDGNGGADYYNPFVNNTAIPAFHFRTRLVTGTFADLAQIFRDGTINTMAGYRFNGTQGVTATKTAGACNLTIQGGIITSVTGC